MTSANSIGLDVHQATIAAAVLDANGKLVMEYTFRDASFDHLKLHPRSSRRAQHYVRGRCICRVALWCAEVRGGHHRGLRSQKEHAAEGGQQE
jgi:hypothetical protein